MIDTHRHVLDLSAVATESLGARGAVVIAATRDSAEFSRLHPELVGRLPPGELQRFEAALLTTSYVVEVGLDGSRGDAALLIAQQRTFERVLELCAGRKIHQCPRLSR